MLQERLWLILFVVLSLCGGCRGKAQQGRQEQLPLRYEIEGLKVDKRSVHWGNVYFGENPADTIRVYNPGTQPVRCRFNYDISYLKVKALPLYLQPGDTGQVIVQLSTAALGRYGDVTGWVRWIDSLGMPRYAMAVTARVKENFHVLNERERSEAPRIYLPERNHDFGEVKPGEKVAWVARVGNQGKNDLIIRNIATPCGCTVVEPDKRVIAPGEEGALKIIFNTAGRSGSQFKTISLLCNDWREPEVLLTIRLTIDEKES